VHRFIRFATSGALPLVLAAAVISQSPAVAAASSESCWNWKGDHTYKELYKISLLESTMLLRWCGADGQVTKFWVDSADARILNSAYLADANASVVPEGELRGPVLVVAGDFSARLVTTDGKAAAEVAARRGPVEGKLSGQLTVDPGRVGDRWRVELYPDGRVIGDVVSG
jgi:hypothetical protein